MLTCRCVWCWTVSPSLLCLCCLDLLVKCVALADAPPRAAFDVTLRILFGQNLHICVRTALSPVGHRCWPRWSLTSWWLCVTTSTSSLSTCPWLSGAPSCRGYKVRARCVGLLFTAHISTDLLSHDLSPDLFLTCIHHTDPINPPDCLAHKHTHTHTHITSHLSALVGSLVNKVCQHFIAQPVLHDTMKTNTGVRAVEMLHGLFTVLPRMSLFLLHPSLFFVVCLCVFACGQILFRMRRSFLGP